MWPLSCALGCRGLPGVSISLGSPAFCSLLLTPQGRQPGPSRVAQVSCCEQIRIFEHGNQKLRGCEFDLILRT